MAELDRPHIRLLDYISQGQETNRSGVPTRELSELPWLASTASIFPLLAALERHGAVESHGEGAVVGGQSTKARWTRTNFGLACLNRLREYGTEHPQDAP